MHAKNDQNNLKKSSPILELKIINSGIKILQIQRKHFLFALNIKKSVSAREHSFSRSSDINLLLEGCKDRRMCFLLLMASLVSGFFLLETYFLLDFLR